MARMSSAEARRSDADSPAFDASGKYLFFTSSDNAGPRRAFGMSAFTFRSLVTRSVNVAVLDKDGLSPLATSNQEKAGGEDSSIRVDPEGIDQRVVRLPLPPRDYAGLVTGKPGVLFVLESRADGPPILHKHDLASRKTERFIEGVDGFVVSADGAHGFQVKELGLNARVPAGGRMVTVELTPKEAGTFEIDCSEYCGSGHRRMKAWLIVRPRM